MPELVHRLPECGNIFGIDLSAAVGSDRHLIEVVGNRSRKFQQFVHLLIVEYHDVACEDHVPEEVAPRLHTACIELAVERFVFLVTEPDLNTVCSLR